MPRRAHTHTQGPGCSSFGGRFGYDRVALRKRLSSFSPHREACSRCSRCQRRADVAKAVDPFAAVWMIYSTAKVAKKAEVPILILVYGRRAVALSVHLVDCVCFNPSLSSSPEAVVCGHSQTHTHTHTHTLKCYTGMKRMHNPHLVILQQRRIFSGGRPRRGLLPRSASQVIATKACSGELPEPRQSGVRTTR
jgi:hypothetical protein